MGLFSHKKPEIRKPSYELATTRDAYERMLKENPSLRNATWGVGRGVGPGRDWVRDHPDWEHDYRVDVLTTLLAQSNGKVMANARIIFDDSFAPVFRSEVLIHPGGVPDEEGWYLIDRSAKMFRLLAKGVENRVPSEFRNVSSRNVLWVPKHVVDYRERCPVVVSETQKFLRLSFGVEYTYVALVKPDHPAAGPEFIGNLSFYEHIFDVGRVRETVRHELEEEARRKVIQDELDQEWRVMKEGFRNKAKLATLANVTHNEGYVGREVKGKEIELVRYQQISLEKSPDIDDWKMEAIKRTVSKSRGRVLANLKVLFDEDFVRRFKPDAVIVSSEGMPTEAGWYYIDTSQREFRHVSRDAANSRPAELERVDWRKRLIISQSAIDQLGLSPGNMPVEISGWENKYFDVGTTLDWRTMFVALAKPGHPVATSRPIDHFMSYDYIKYCKKRLEYAASKKLGDPWTRTAEGKVGGPLVPEAFLSGENVDMDDLELVRALRASDNTATWSFKNSGNDRDEA